MDISRFHFEQICYAIIDGVNFNTCQPELDIRYSIHTLDENGNINGGGAWYPQEYLTLVDNDSNKGILKIAQHWQKKIENDNEVLKGRCKI